MTRLRNMRIVNIRPFMAVVSGERTLDDIFGENGFDSWCSGHRDILLVHPYEPCDLLWHVGDPSTYGRGLNVLARMVRDGVTAADVLPYELMEFPGGTYLVATADETDTADINETVSEMQRWISESGVFEYGGFPESGMCNMPAPDSDTDRVLNIAQQQIFLPIKMI